jgi:type I restriction enzyme S subunit
MYVIHSEISLLTEYRIRLISDVVTGKVDVRDIEIPEYEADSDETIDDEIDDNLVLDEEDGEMEVE